MRRGLPVHVSRFKDRHGKWRMRARQQGRAVHYFKSDFGTPEFEIELQAWRDGTPTSTIGRKKVVPGSVADVVARYYTSTSWAGLAPSTKKNMSNRIERLRTEHGDKPIKSLERVHIQRMIDVIASTPVEGRNLLKAIRALMRVAVDDGLRPDDPTQGVKCVRRASSGLHTWTEEEIDLFEAKHPPGTRAHLAFALMLYTGQRRGDVIKMGWQHIRDGRLYLRQRKTGVNMAVAIHPALAQALAAVARDNLTFLVTTFGKPFGDAGFGNWFRARCNEAGLPQCSAHGLRKAAARRLAEAGCSASQIAAVTGHRSLREVERYTVAASQITMADAAISAVSKANPGARLANPQTKALKSHA